MTTFTPKEQFHELVLELLFAGKSPLLTVRHLCEQYGEEHEQSFKQLQELVQSKPFSQDVRAKLRWLTTFFNGLHKSVRDGVDDAVINGFYEEFKGQLLVTMEFPIDDVR
jgi:hypothetical protein